MTLDISDPTRIFITMLSKRIKELREKKGWSQRQLGRAAGLSTNHISKIESDVTQNPRIDTLLKISIALECPKAEFFS
jgi:transcriptional regulator with XRE-family HTH domain